MGWTLNFRASFENKCEGSGPRNFTWRYWHEFLSKKSPNFDFRQFLMKFSQNWPKTNFKIRKKLKIPRNWKIIINWKLNGSIWYYVLYNYRSNWINSVNYSRSYGASTSISSDCNTVYNKNTQNTEKIPKIQQKFLKYSKNTLYYIEFQGSPQIVTRYW